MKKIHRNLIITAILFILITSIGTVYAGQILITTLSDPVPRGTTTTIPVIVTEANDLAAFTILVKSGAENTVTIVPNQTRPEGLLGELFSSSLKNNKVSWASSIPVSGTQTLFYIDVTPSEGTISPIPVTVTLEKLSDSSRNDVTGTYTVVPLNLILKDTLHAPIVTGNPEISPPVTSTSAEVTITTSTTSTLSGTVTSSTTAPAVDATTEPQTPAATQGPVPVLGILAGLGAAVILGRKFI